MKTNTIIWIGVGALALIGTAAYITRDKWMPKEPVVTPPAEPIKEPTTTTTTTTANTEPLKPASKYGFKVNEFLYAKKPVVNVYNYPEALSKNWVGFIQQSATSQAKFLADSSVNGFIKANSKYIKKGGVGQNVAEVYIVASEITNVAP